VSVKLFGPTSTSPYPERVVFARKIDFKFSGQRLTFRLPLDEILKWAFELKDWELDGPQWLDSNLYDAQAIMPEGSNRADARPMVQAMLRDRFGLKFHREARDLPVMALVVSKAGFRLHAVADTGHPTQEGGWDKSGGPFHIRAKEVSLQTVAQMLNHMMELTVVDQTGLTGLYDVDVRGPELDLASLNSILEHELGLRLQKTRLPCQVLVVDSIAKTPTEN
jgi:uncharacterized protein (TIGR03435 family)